MPNVSSGEVNHPSGSTFRSNQTWDQTVMRYLQINPPKPFALQYLFHYTLVDRSFHSLWWPQCYGFLQDVWLSSIIPLLMALLPESSAFKDETFKSPVRRGQSLGNRVVKKRRRKGVERNTGNVHRTQERHWRKNKVIWRARWDREAGAQLSLRGKRYWVTQILPFDRIRLQKPFLIS